MKRLSEIKGFKRLYAYFESNKVRQGVKMSVADISTIPSDFTFEDIPNMSDETIRLIIRSNHQIYGNGFLMNIVSGMLLNYFGAFNPGEENKMLKRTDKYLSLYIEYILRRIKKCEGEFKALGIKDDRLKKIMDVEAIILDDEEKYEVFKNIVNLQIVNHDPKDKTRFTAKELCEDKEFVDFANQVRVIIFGNVMEFTQETLDTESTGLLDIFGLRGMNAVGLSTTSQTIGLPGNIKMNLVGEKQEDEAYNTYLHELWHATEKFMTSIIGELIPGGLDDYDIEKDFSASKMFKGMHKEDILSDFAGLKNKNIRFYKFLFSIEEKNDEINIGYLKINQEFIAQLIGTNFFNGQGVPTTEEMTKICEDMSLRLMNYIRPFSIQLKYSLSTLERHFDISEEDYDKLIRLVEKYFNVLFGVVTKLLSLFIRLTIIRGNRQAPFVELGFIPLHKWESYVRLQERKMKMKK